jgi:hypothetical protein
LQILLSEIGHCQPLKSSLSKAIVFVLAKAIFSLLNIFMTSEIRLGDISPFGSCYFGVGRLFSEKYRPNDFGAFF